VWKLFNKWFDWEYILIDDRYVRRIRKDTAGRQFVEHHGMFRLFNTVPDGKFSNSSATWVPLTFKLPELPDPKNIILDGNNFVLHKYIDHDDVVVLLGRTVTKMAQIIHNQIDSKNLTANEQEVCLKIVAELKQTLSVLADPEQWRHAARVGEDRVGDVYINDEGQSRAIRIKKEVWSQS